MSERTQTRRFYITSSTGALQHATVAITVTIDDGMAQYHESSDERFNRAASAALASIKTGRIIREVVGPLDGPNTYLEPAEPEGWQPNAE